MKPRFIAATLAASIAWTLPAWADPIYVWRPSEGAKAGQILPADAFTVSTPPEIGGVDYRSSDYGAYSHYTTRNVALAVGDFLSVPIPSVFGAQGCRVLTDGANRTADQWVTASIAGGSGKYTVSIHARSSGRLELTIGCFANTSGDVVTMHQEYLALTIS